MRLILALHGKLFMSFSLAAVPTYISTSSPAEHGHDIKALVLEPFSISTSQAEYGCSTGVLGVGGCNGFNRYAVIVASVSPSYGLSSSNS